MLSAVLGGSGRLLNFLSLLSFSSPPLAEGAHAAASAAYRDACARARVLRARGMAEE